MNLSNKIFYNDAELEKIGNTINRIRTMLNDLQANVEPVDALEDIEEWIRDLNHDLSI